MDDDLRPAIEGLRAMITAGDQYRLQAAAYFGLGLSDTYAISHLHARGALTQGDLARLVGVSTSGATVLIDRMEAAGIAQRTTDAEDRRRVLIELTAAGQAILDESSERLRLVFAEVPRDQLGRTAALLQEVAAALTVQAGELRQRFEDARARLP